MRERWTLLSPTEEDWAYELKQCALLRLWTVQSK